MPVDVGTFTFLEGNNEVKETDLTTLATLTDASAVVVAITASDGFTTAETAYWETSSLVPEGADSATLTDAGILTLGSEPAVSDAFAVTEKRLKFQIYETPDGGTFTDAAILGAVPFYRVGSDSATFAEATDLSEQLVAESKTAVDSLAFADVGVLSQQGESAVGDDSAVFGESVRITIAVVGSDTQTFASTAAGAIGIARTDTATATEGIVDVPATVTVGTTGWLSQNAATLSQSADQAKYGTYSLKVVTSGSTANQGAYADHATTGLVAANTRYTASVYARGNGTVRLDLFEYPDPVIGGLIGSTAGVATVLSPTAWTRLITTRQFGPTGEYAIPLVRTTTAQAVTFYLDGAVLEATGGALFTDSGAALKGTNPSDEEAATLTDTATIAAPPINSDAGTLAETVAIAVSSDVFILQEGTNQPAAQFTGVVYGDAEAAGWFRGRAVIRRHTTADLTVGT
jgi:hypothetical protein